MKVVIYSGEIPSTTFIERLIIGLAESDVKVILHGQIIKEAIKYDSKNIKVIGYRTKISKFWLMIKYIFLFCLTQPIQLIKLTKYYSNKNSDLSFLIWFARVAPIIWHKPDIFHLQWAKGIEDWIFLKEFGIKVVVSLRGAHINYSPIIDKNLAKKYLNYFPSVDGFHGVSHAICYEASKYAAELNKCKIVYSGLNLQDFLFNKLSQINRDKIKIISIGRSHWKKGYKYALDAMRILKEDGISFNYRIIGGIDEKLIYQVSELGLEKIVSLEKKLEFDEIKKVIQNADILLMSSVEEGIPNVVLEAMALGTIVVSTDCGGVSEVIEDDKNGFLVPIRNSAAISDKIQSVMKLSTDEQNLIRQNARQKIETQHNHQKMIDDMKNLYLSII